MWLTPNPAIARRMPSESPCCVPAFIRAAPRFPADGDCGFAAIWALTTPSASAVTATLPAPVRRTNSRRFMASSFGAAPERGTRYFFAVEMSTTSDTTLPRTSPIRGGFATTA